MEAVKASEFGKLIGRSRQYINTNKARGVIIAEENGKYNLENPINKAWLKRMREQYIAEQAKPGGDIYKDPNLPSKKNNDSSEDKESNSSPSSSSDQLSFALQKQQADLELKLLTLKEKEIELNRKQGKLLNVDTASKITMAYMSMFKKSLHRDLETLIHRICDVYKIDLEKKAGYVNELIGIMNNSSDRTMEELNNSLQTENVEL